MIQPILNAQGLIDEGREQLNCVGGFANLVRIGHTYIYKVLAPERATLSIVLGPGGQWVIGELKLHSNIPCGYITAKYVTDWLENRPILH